MLSKYLKIDDIASNSPIDFTKAQLPMGESLKAANDEEVQLNLGMESLSVNLDAIQEIEKSRGLEPEVGKKLGIEDELAVNDELDLTDEEYIEPFIER